MAVEYGNNLNWLGCKPMASDGTRRRQPPKSTCLDGQRDLRKVSLTAIASFSLLILPADAPASPMNDASVFAFARTRPAPNLPKVSSTRTAADLLPLVAGTVGSHNPFVAMGREPPELDPVTLPILAGMQPLEYAAVLEEARTLFSRRSWSDAIPLYERLVRAYPHDGDTWRELAVARYNNSDFSRAAAAYENAARLGVSPGRSRPDVGAARAHARAGNSDLAVAWLNRALDETKHTNPDALLAEATFESLRHHSGFQQLAARRSAQPGLSRNARWIADIEFYLTEVRRIKSNLPEAVFRNMVQAADALKRRVPQLRDTQIAVALDQISAIPGHGHSSFHHWWTDPSPFTETQRLNSPIDIYWFSDGLFVIGADDAHRHLIGAEILRVGSLPVGEALARARTTLAQDNDSGSAFWAPQQLVNPAILHALGMSSDPTTWSMHLRLATGRTTTSRFRGIEGRPPVHPILAARRPPSSAPFYLRDTDQWYRTEQIGDDTLFVQLNQTSDTADLTLSQFGRDIGQRLQSPVIKTVVLDLRHNKGGNTYAYRELLRALVAFDVRASSQLYVLTSRHTGSAAVNLVTDLERLAEIVVVGEPYAGRPSSPGDPVHVRLPNTGLTVSVSSTTWALSGPADTRIWISPTIPVVLTSQDYFSDRDPALEAALAHSRNDER
jgi:tetratricopeptide (TPR) repeat protein